MSDVSKTLEALLKGGEKAANLRKFENTQNRYIGGEL
jgi:hypothetical protein